MAALVIRVYEDIVHISHHFTVVQHADKLVKSAGPFADALQDRHDRDAF